MLIFAPGELAEWTGGTWSRLPARPLRGFAIDSRRIVPGDVFVALRTERRDGHDFVGEAVARGAGAVLVGRPVDPALPALLVEDPATALRACAQAHRQRFAKPVIGITGSCGKTSTKDLLHRLLGETRTLATEANLNNTLGVPLTLLRLDPEAHDWAVIEAGINEVGEMDLLAAMIAPSHAIVTMVGLAHASGLGDEASIAREKAKLPAATHPDGVVMFPATCRQYPPFAAFPARPLTVSEPEGGGEIVFRTKRGESASGTRLVRQRDRQDTQTEETGTREACILEMTLPGPTLLSFAAPAMTPGMVQNAVLALAMAHALGVSEKSLQSILLEWRPSRHRGEVRVVGSQTYYIDCYNANPASMIDALRFFAERFAGQPKLYVLGSMRELGAFSAASHRKVGAALQLEAADRAVFVGDHAEDFFAGAIEGGNAPAQLASVKDAEQARPTVVDFQGAILFKSSRAYALERLLPADTTSEERGDVAC